MGNFLSGESPLALEYTVPTEGSEATGSRSAAYRSATHPNELVSALVDGGIENGYDVFQRGCRLRRAQPCLGRRKVTMVNGERVFGDYEWWTYGEVEAMAQMLGSGILYEDLVATNSFPDEAYEPARALQTIGVCSKNRLEWFVLEQAANSYSLTLVPLYDTLGDEAMLHMISLTRMTCVAVSAESITQLLQVLMSKPREDSLRHIICFDPPTDDVVLVARKMSLSLHYWADLMDLGKDKGLLPLRLPKSEDVATICFTSGTTGLPKGALLTHRMFAATVCGCVRGPYADKRLDITGDDVYMSYLPLAHVYERAMILLVYVKGARVAIYSGEAKTLLDDMKIARPTIFVSVPRLYMRINDKINAGVKDNSTVARYLFNIALDAKVSRLRSTGDTTHRIWDRLVFNRVKALMGGRLRYMFSGGAALEIGIQERMAVLFCCPFLEGYGLTETMGVTFGRKPHDSLFGHVGSVLPCAEVCFESVPEMGYEAADQKGEILVRGPQVTPGYFLNPGATAEAFSSDGWFKTGDIGVRLQEAGGRMKIIDRRKNIFKMSQGEYVAVERIESLYGAAALVSQIYIYGDSSRTALVAIICVDLEELERWSKANQTRSPRRQNSPSQDKTKSDADAVETAATTSPTAGGKGSSAAELVQDPRLKKAVKEQLKELEKGLKGFEKVRAFHLEHEQFTVDSDLLTPTFKLKRHKLFQKYEPVIMDLYRQIDAS